VPVPDVTIDTLRTIHDIFIRMAEAAPQNWGVRLGLPIDDAVEDMWAMLESGDLRLVGEQQWPLVAARRRVLCGLYEPQGARVHG
jgi:hypothetical protein